MKKLFSTLLTLVFVLSFGSLAIADTPVTPDENPTAFTYFKSFTNPDVHPAGTFEFTVDPLRVENYTATEPDVPEFGNGGKFTIELEENGVPVSGGLTFPTYLEIGDYYYTITETEGKIAGVTYSTTPRILRVVVGRVMKDDEEVIKPLYYLIYADSTEDSQKKADGVENDYNAGSLEVKKNVTGSFGNRDVYFSVKVTFTVPEGMELGSTITYSGGKYESEVSVEENGVISALIEIKHDETVTFTNIPVGVTWTVEEMDAKGHTPTYSTEDGGVEADKTTTVTIFNNLDKEVETGISLDSIPYIMILGLAVLGIGGLFLRRRKNTDF